MNTNTLREAATKMRERAIAATPGPWLAFDMDEGRPADDKINVDGWWWVWSKAHMPHYGGVLEPESHAPDCDQKYKDAKSCCRTVVGSGEITDGSEGAKERADVEYIASMHPLVALAVADLLEKVADDYEADEVYAGAEAGVYEAAFAVARFYLGEDV